MARKGTAGTRRVTFALMGEPGHKIFLSGSFNGWNAKRKQMKDEKGDGMYTAVCMLEPGEHQYKFIIDGIWVNDMENPNIAPDGHGGLNNVIEVE